MSLNIEDIMSEIRADIKDKGLSGDMLSFADIPCDANPRNPVRQYDPDQLRKNISYVSDYYALSTENELEGGAFSRFIKKVVRKLTRFYVEPVADEQSAINANTAQALQQLELYTIDSQEQNTVALSKRVDALELQQKNSRMEIESLRKQVAALSEQLAALRKEQS